MTTESIDTIEKTVNGVTYFIDIETTITHHSDWGDGFPGADETDEEIIKIVFFDGDDNEVAAPREKWSEIINSPKDN